MAFGKKMAEAQAANAAAKAAKEAPAAEPTIDVKPLVIKEPAPTLTSAQQAEIDRIMADAKQKAQQVILGGSPEAKLGTPSGNVEEKQEAYQRDHLPGQFRKDKTYVPAKIYDEDAGVERQVLRPADEVRYVMIPADDFLTYTNLGYKFCKYDGGNQSGLLGNGFRGTGDAVFTRELNGNCRRGDVFLMWIHTRAWEQIRAEDVDKAGDAHKRALGVFHNVGYNVGIRPSAEVDGQKIF